MLKVGLNGPRTEGDRSSDEFLLKLCNCVKGRDVGHDDQMVMVEGRARRSRGTCLPKSQRRGLLLLLHIKPNTVTASTDMSSSFRRIRPNSAPPPPPGSILFPTLSLPHISTGLASLDDVLAPGQPLSSSLLVLTPDTHSAWGKLIQRYWIAQGLVGGQGVVVLGGRGEPEELVSGCMWIVGGEKRTEGGEMSGVESEGELVDERGEGKGGQRIAWRYGNMSKFKTTVDSSSSSGE